MTLEEVKDSLYDTVQKYFEAGTVIWAEHGNTVPPRPYMTMKMNAVSRAAFPIEEEETSLRQRAYQCSSILEVNLYTKGKAVTAEEGVTAGCINTAVSGMGRFSNYMESEYITDLLADRGIAVSLMPPVKDLSFLESGNAWLYRAMAEYSVSFVMEADGAYGISCFETQPGSGAGNTGSLKEQDFSGGGTKELADTLIGTIEDAEMTGEYEE